MNTAQATLLNMRSGNKQNYEYDGTTQITYLQNQLSMIYLICCDYYDVHVKID